MNHRPFLIFIPWSAFQDNTLSYLCKREFPTNFSTLPLFSNLFKVRNCLRKQIFKKLAYTTLSNLPLKILEQNWAKMTRRLKMCSNNGIGRVRKKFHGFPLDFCFVSSIYFRPEKWNQTFWARLLFRSLFPLKFAF